MIKTDKELRKQGFKFAVKIETKSGLFEKEIYFKNSSEVNPFLKENYINNKNAKLSRLRLI
jgi:hypothetical protein